MIRWVCLIMVFVLVALPVSGADAVKLRPLISVYVDGEGRGIKAPRAVACDANSVVISDTGNERILIYAADESSVRFQSQIAVGQVQVPLALGLLEDGEILVLDGRSRKIARLSRTGEFLGYFEPGGVLGPFTPTNLVVAQDSRVYLLDVRGARVLVLDAKGAVQKSIAFAEDVGFISDLAVDRRGDVYVVDSVARRVDVARSGDTEFSHLTPSLAEELDFPTAIALDDSDRLFVIDENGAGVVVLARDGSFRGRQLSMGWREGFLRYPTDACVGKRGELFIAERGNSRVQMFRIR